MTVPAAVQRSMTSQNWFGVTAFIARIRPGTVGTKLNSWTVVFGSYATTWVGPS